MVWLTVSPTPPFQAVHNWGPYFDGFRGSLYQSQNIGVVPIHPPLRGDFDGKIMRPLELSNLSAVVKETFGTLYRLFFDQRPLQLPHFSL